MANDRAQRLRLLEAARLYFVCEARPHGRDPDELLDAALRGGAHIVQMREKSPRSVEELVAFAEPFRRAAREHEALFILNDRPDLVAACGADGVHVGQEDMSVAEARGAAGTEALIGLSTHSPEQIEAACGASGDDRPDQLSVGPVWETPTKAGRPATGLRLIDLAAREATVPWFAIGGIDSENVTDVAAAGASRVVVVRAIRDADDPESAARALRRGLGGTVGGVRRAKQATGADG
jgi:thiamine-phosphate pyrophosphorylase